MSAFLVLAQVAGLLGFS